MNKTTRQQSSPRRAVCSRRSVQVLATIALIATAGAYPSLSQAAQPDTPAEKPPEIIELPRQTLTFKPTRDDITVGCVMLSLHPSDLAKTNALETIRVNGAKPKTSVLYLKRVEKNQFEMPAVKIEYSTKDLSGPLYLTAKVWFNELTNQYDSSYYEHTPDRYALLSYCTKEDEDPSKVNARLGANRVASLKEFRERLAKPIVIKLNKRPLREEWGRWPMSNNTGVLTDADMKAVEQIVRGRDEKFVISITVKNKDAASVFVGDHDLFEVARRYDVARTDGAWRIDKVDKQESGW